MTISKPSRFHSAVRMLIFAICVTIASACAASQSSPAVPEPAPATVQLVTMRSNALGRDMNYNAVLPADYQSNPNKRYAVVYLLHGLTGHYNDWPDRTPLTKIAAKYPFILITPEANDSWYTDSPVTSERYESYVINDVIPDVDKRFRTNATRAHRVVAGLSMGGYGSVKFALKYPNRFSLAGSFSGAFGIPQWSEKAPGSKLIGRSIDAVFGPIDSDARRQNDIYRMAADLTPDQVRRLPYFYISCGTEDTAMIKLNNDLHTLLDHKHVPHEYHPLPGIHDWVFWSKEIETFLAEADRLLTTK